MRPGRRRAGVAALLATSALVVTGCTTTTPGASGTGPASAAATAPAPGGQGRGPDASIAAKARLAGLDPCPAGDPGAGARADGLPDLTLSCLGPAGAREVRLAGLRGRPVLVNVWAQWCGPCREEAPLLQRLHRAAGSRLTVLGVDYQDDDVPALAFAAEEGLHYPSVTAPEDQFPLRRWAPGPPLTLLVAPDGKVTRVKRGPFTSWQQLTATVHDALGVSL